MKKDRMLFDIKMQSILMLIIGLIIVPCCSSIQPTIQISLEYGHNSYNQIERYFGSSQKLSITDMKSAVDLKNYHFCFIQSSSSSELQTIDSCSFNQILGNDSSKSNMKNKSTVRNNSRRRQPTTNTTIQPIIYNLDDIISTQNILTTHYYHIQNQQHTKYLLILKSTQIITVKIQQQPKQSSLNNIDTNQSNQKNIKNKEYKIIKINKQKLIKPTTKAKFITINNNNSKANNINNNQVKNNNNNQVNNNNDKNNLLLMTDSQLYQVQINQNKQNHNDILRLVGQINTQQQQQQKRILQQISPTQTQTQIKQKDQPSSKQIQEQQSPNQIQEQTKTQNQQQQPNIQQQQNKKQQPKQQQKDQEQQKEKQQQQKEKQQQQKEKQQQQKEKQLQKQQHLTSVLKIDQDRILILSNKNSYLYDLTSQQFQFLNKQSKNNNNNPSLSSLYSDNIQVQIVSNPNNNITSNSNNNIISNNTNQSSLLLILTDTGSNDAKLTYYHNTTQFLSSISTNQSSISTSQSSTTTNQSASTLNVTESSLSQSTITFYSLSNTHKCKHINQFNHKYLFLQCKNHLLYFNIQDLMNCHNLTSSNNTQQCLNTIKSNHLNLGYHIKSLQFNQQTNYLTITGVDKYQIFYIDYSTQSQKINSIKNVATQYFNQNMKQVHMIDYNTSLIITKNNLFIVKQKQQNKQVYCKTVDEHTHKALSQPTGLFNGTIIIQGLCQDSLFVQENKSQYYEKVQNSTYCRYNIPFIVNVTYVVKTYQFVWYILLGVGVLMTIVSVLYCVIKRQKLQQIYKTLQEEKQQGQPVAQNTTVTQTSQSQQQTLPIDNLKQINY